MNELLFFRTPVNAKFAFKFEVLCKLYDLCVESKLFTMKTVKKVYAALTDQHKFHSKKILTTM